MPSEVVVRSIAGTKFGQQVTARNHNQISDEPAAVGGSDLGPTPYEQLLAALGS